jgi:hypothetical protein
MHSAVAAMAICAGLVTAGCDGSARDQIRSTVEQLAQAAGARDYTTICQQILAPSLVAHLVRNQISCEQAMRVSLSGVRNPVISIGKITISGKHASVITLTVAQGQQASLNAIELVDTSDGWRISSLGSPLTATGG